MKFNAVNNARSPSRIRATSDGFVERPEETRGCPRHVFDSILRALGPILLGVRMKDEREGESGENDIVKDFGKEAVLMVSNGIFSEVTGCIVLVHIDTYQCIPVRTVHVHGIIHDCLGECMLQS